MSFHKPFVFLTVLMAALAAALASAAEEDEASRDIVRVRELPDQPWLRINAGGHTAGVRGLAFTPDGKRLCSAGLDKVVQVWNLTAVGRDLRRTFLRERTIRWQVARGLRGSIFALAAAPNDGLLAIGGYGAMGSLGEILLVRPLDGALVKVLEGHRQTVCSLSFSADGNWLASADASGHAILWNRNGWQSRTLYEPDAKTYDAATVRQIEIQPKLRPIVIVRDSVVAVPACIGPQASGRPGWKLQEISIANPGQFRTLDVVHEGMVTALAASHDGSLLASADLAGKLFLWDLKAGGPPQELASKAIVLSLSFSPDGRTLAAGTAVASPRNQSELQIWDIATRTVRRAQSLPDHVNACLISPDGKDVAYGGGKDNEVFVERLDAPQTATLGGTGRRVLKVAFAREEPYYRVAIGTTPRQRAFNDYADLEQTFDPLRLELGGPPIKPADWLQTEWLQGTWTARTAADGGLQLYRDNQPQGRVVLDPVMEGRPRCYAWIASADGQPLAIAVGTDVQNSVYVYRLAERGTCPILRHFRGHNDYLTSLSVSRDLRYLASASADGMVIFWSLASLEKGAEPLGRWGAEFAVRDGRLTAASVDPAGPLFLKGLRTGDVIDEIGWFDQQAQSEKRADQMLQQLRELPWFTQVVFESSRAGARRPAFQLVPAWQPLATLFINSGGEWAFWTPQGYYDASVNGFTLFGWQVNRGLHVLPDFYRADQFQKKLERPDVMKTLLPAGSLEAAFEAAKAQPPAEAHRILPEQIAATPRIEILSPRAGELLADAATRVRARVRMPPAGKLIHAKVYANGVVGARQQLVEQREVDQQREMVLDWDVRLPSDERNLIQLVVGTDAPTAAFADVLVERPAAAKPPAGRLSIIAAGINKYADPAIQPLDFAVADADALAKTLRERSSGLYELDRVIVLGNEAVTRAAWRKALEQTAGKLQKNAQPDDLLVLFFAGHGIVDPKTKQYYYVGHDFKVADLEQRDFSSCISWEDLRVLADLPCRKLVLLDTCHSGAIQPLRSENLKSAIRALQEDVIFTVSASAGNELSAEKKSWGHGAFTKTLLEALRGQPGTPSRPIVTLNDVVLHVRRAVPELTSGRQNPVAAPGELLPFTTLRLAAQLE